MHIFYVSLFVHRYHLPLHRTSAMSVDLAKLDAHLVSRSYVEG